MFIRKNQSYDAVKCYQQQITVLSQEAEIRKDTQRAALGILYKKIGSIYSSVENNATTAIAYFDLAVENGVLDTEIRLFYSSTVYRNSANESLSAMSFTNDRPFTRYRWITKPLKVPNLKIKRLSDETFKSPDDMIESSNSTSSIFGVPDDVLIDLEEEELSINDGRSMPFEKFFSEGAEEQDN
jgi:hypothetical protein